MIVNQKNAHYALYVYIPEDGILHLNEICENLHGF
jgi:hypothetical protein